MNISLDDQIPNFSTCPRCGDHLYDRMGVQSMCVGCLYSPVLDVPQEDPVPKWALDAISDIVEEENLTSEVA